jgi:hypothetical protein
MSALAPYTDRARAEVRQVLAGSPSFRGLKYDEQQSLYRDMVESRAMELATLSGAMAEPKAASELIDRKRHENRRIDQAGDLAGDFVDQVDFPGFVKDLVKGVFDANMKVTVEQMQAYQTLLKNASASVSKFINAIDDTSAFGYLAENNSEEFSLDFTDETEADGSRKVALTDKDGNRLDVGDNELKARIMDAKIRMAQEQRAMLREMLLMGVTRLVVEKGVIKASVVFDVKAQEKIALQDKAQLTSASSSGGSVTASGGIFGKIFGGPTAGHSWSNQKTKISVSSAKSESSTDLAAKITGSVEINFKTDYFALDNFASMYQQGAGGGATGTGGVPQPGAPPGAAPQLPAGAQR